MDMEGIRYLIEKRRQAGKTWEQIASELTRRHILYNGNNKWSRYRVSRWYREYGAFIHFGFVESRYVR